MPNLDNRIQETTTTTGTGAITLAGAVAGYQSLAAGLGAFSVGNVPYLLVSGTAWEVGKGTFNGTTGFTRDVVEESSNSGNAITLAGTSNIYVTMTASLVSAASTGAQYALMRGFALP